MAKFDKRLGSILLGAQLLDEDSLQRAMELATGEDKSLSCVVIEREMVAERAFVRSVSAEMRIPPIDLARAAASDDALGCLPQDMALYYGVLPVAKIGNVLTMAVDTGHATLVQRLDVVLEELTQRHRTSAPAPPSP